MNELAKLVHNQLKTGNWGLETSKINTHKSTLIIPNAPSPTSTGSTIALRRAEYPLVGTATLELGDAPLHEQIREFASVALASNGNTLQVLPLFLLPGVHVREDIPNEVALAKASLGDAIAIVQQPYIGTHPNLLGLLTSQWATVDADAKILLSHGTRRAGGNQPVEAIAKQLQAVTAYWSVQPSLEEQIKGLASAGHKTIAILPYFLFPGGITDAIAQRVTELQAEFPQLHLKVGEPIGASPQLARLIVDLLD